MSLKYGNTYNLGTLNPAKRMKEQIKSIENYLSIVIEAIKNNDSKDAIQMLEEIKQDLKLIELMA